MRISYDGARAYLTELDDSSRKLIDRALCLGPLEIDTVDSLCLTNNNGGNCYLYKNEGQDISIFTSHIPEVYRNGDGIELRQSLIRLDIDDDVELDERLRPYQVDSIRAFLSKQRGIIKLPTSSGKSFVIAEIARLFNTAGMDSALITTSTKALLYQLRDDLIAYGIKSELIGLVGDGNKNITKPITIAIPDTLALAINREDEEILSWLAKVGVWVQDEQHTLGNISGVLLSNALIGTSYRLGLSATPWSNQGLTKLLYGISGPIIYEMSEEDAISDGYIMQPIVYMHESPKAYAPPALLNRSYSHGIYNILYNLLVLKNSGRNKLIASIVSECLSNNDGAVVVIVNKVATDPNHPELLLPLIKAKGYELPLCTGKTKTKELNRVIEGLRDGSIPGAMFGPGVMKEGVNIPSIKYLILCGAGSSDISLLQRVGRALRNKEGKDEVYIHDIYDQQSFFKGQAEKRILTYKDKYGLDSVNVINLN